MKGIKFILVLCLFASLYCSKAIISCTLDKMLDSTCDTFVNYCKTSKTQALHYMFSRKGEFFHNMKSCF